MQFDISVVGGGIVGGMLTRKLAQIYPSKKILLLEKEDALGLHTSTRNSAVLHAGFYYSTDTIKAKLCKEGNRTLTQYCLKNKIKFLNTGKFVVARNREESDRLVEIKRQGDINGVELELMPYDKAIQIEKYLKFYEKDFNYYYKYLYSPTTSVADSKGIMASINNELNQASNVTVLTNYQYKSYLSTQANTTLHSLFNKKTQQNQTLQTQYFINSAGLYADQIAHQMGFGTKYASWPFKGSYLIQKCDLPQPRAIIYPVPPLRGNYFLGIHTTLTVDGTLKIGPSIAPALWREQYSLTENFNFQEFREILALNLRNAISKDMSIYMQSLLLELKKLSTRYMINETKKLTTQLDGIQNLKFERGKAGIRSQLFNVQEKKMVQDFIFEHDKNSLHFLNVASPGWTCSIPMAEHVSEIIKQYI